MSDKHKEQNLIQVVFGVLFLVVIGYNSKDSSIGIMLWRNFCASAVFLIFFNRIKDSVDTDILLSKYNNDRIKWFLGFVKEKFKLFIATICFLSIPLFFFFSEDNQSVFSFVFKCCISGILIACFVSLNYLIAAKLRGHIGPNKLTALLTLIPLGISIIATGFGYEFLSYLFMPNLNLLSKNLLVTWYAFLPLPYLIFQLFLGLYPDKKN